MVTRNPHLSKLQAGYLFPEITKRKKQLLEKNPTAEVISLSIGDTTEPLPPTITKGLTEAAAGLGSRESYSGYGPSFGNEKLRAAIATELYDNHFSADEIFISDGAKCDIGRLQVLFGSEATVAVQDPAYPAYVDSAVIMGQTEGFNQATSGYNKICYMNCTPENNFFPDLSSLPRTDLIFFCSPNNPTGAVATHAQLSELVAFAKKNKSIILFDVAYASFIRDPSLPRSIYEIEGAEEVAIETGSFSKMAGFTGVRLGWTLIPKALKYEDGNSLHNDWSRVVSTLFNAPSNISQAGGIAVLTKEGLEESRQMVDFYLENAKILKKVIEGLGLKVYGGENTPYLWTDYRPKKSWELFEEILTELHIVTTPGSGFGPAGEGFIRFSAFGKREDIEKAAEKLADYKVVLS